MSAKNLIKKLGEKRIQKRNKYMLKKIEKITFIITSIVFAFIFLFLDHSLTILVILAFLFMWYERIYKK